MFSSTEILELDIPNADAFYVVDGTIEKLLTKSPIFIANANMFVYINDRNRIGIYSILHNNDSHCINIVDSSGNVRMNATIYNDAFEINQRYRIREDGTVMYNVLNEGNMTDSVALRLKVMENTTVFKALVYKFNRWDFDLYPAGALLLDPLQEKLRE